MTNHMIQLQPKSLVAGIKVTLPLRKSDVDQVPAETLKEISEFPFDVLVDCWKSHDNL